MRNNLGLRAGLAVGCLVAAVAPVRAESHTTGAPVLNSNPGAAYTLYLDFGGFTFTGGWGGDGNSAPGTMVPFDSASTTGSFSATEQGYIKTVFARAAEKYVGMSVNVTTVDPAVSAGQAGTDFARQAYYDSQARMMHTVVTSTIQANNSFVAGGGVSYVGVTQNSYSSAGINGGAGRGYHTNWDFTDQLANQNTGKVNAGTLKYIAECAGHENGHGLKLNHQSAYNGTTKTAEYSDNGGSATVAPIMGGSYDSARGTWRTGATSTSTTIQNDVATLLTNAGMTSFIDDGVGHTQLSASPLLLNAGGVLGTGVNDGYIVPTAVAGYAATGGENAYTKDYFSFATTGGAYNLTINESNDLLAAGVADGGGTLDSVFRLIDANGSVLSSSTNPNSQTGTLSGSLSAGTYYLQVVSAGGKASNVTATSNETASYFDMGSYFLSGSVAVAVPEPTALAGLLAIGLTLGRRRRVVA